MRIKLNQRQKSLLMEFKKRAYSFDWDDNILFMPTKIHLDKKVGEGWFLFPFQPKNSGK